jgi:hypothetical protein
MDRRCVPLKATALFPPAKMAKLRSAVSQIHAVVVQASLLIKLFFLDHPAHLPRVDSDLVRLAFHAVQGTAPAARAVARGKDGEDGEDGEDGDDGDDGDDGEDGENGEDAAKEAAAKAKIAKNAATAEAIAAFNDTLQRHGISRVPRIEASASHILADCANDLVTAYKNNVEARYDAYFWRLAAALSTLVHGPTRSPAKTALTTQLSTFLRDGKGVAPTARAVGVRARLAAPTVPAGGRGDRPWVRLSAMVRATRELENLKIAAVAEGHDGADLGRFKLLSPFCLHSSFIPSHIHLHTSSMVQLLGSAPDVAVFKARYLAECGVALNVSNLSNVASSFHRATGAPPESPAHEAAYFRMLWETVCSFDAKKAYKQLVQGTQRRASAPALYPDASLPSHDTWLFDNSVTTDGVVVHFAIVKAVDCRKKKFGVDRQLQRHAKKKKVQEARDGTVREFDVLNAQTAPGLVDLLDATKFKLVAGDPGKGDIVRLNDGGRVIVYSAASRAADTLLPSRRQRANRVRQDAEGERRVVGTFRGVVRKRRDKRVERKRRRRKRRRGVVLENPSVAQYEEAVLSVVSKRTCDAETFAEYVRRRDVMAAAAARCYERPVFRNQRFTALTLRQRSEMAFFDRVEATFAKPAPAGDDGDVRPVRSKANRVHAWMSRRAAEGDVVLQEIETSLEVTEPRQLAVLYGDWGKTPNLKGSAPTPGIGFRRRLARRFLTVTLGEAYTSQVCPCCSRRSLEVASLEGDGRSCGEKHHLLRCQIGDCSRWWNRDSAASMNQLYKGVHLLLGGADNDWFEDG